MLDGTQGKKLNVVNKMADNEVGNMSLEVLH